MKASACIRQPSPIQLNTLQDTSLLLGLSWHGLQGSIQASLAAAPLELAYIYKSGAHHYRTWAQAITVVGVFSILLGATIAWLAAAFLGPALLTKVNLFSTIYSFMMKIQ